MEVSPLDVVSQIAEAGAQPDASALVCGSDVLSYEQLDERVDRLASFLSREHGVGAGSIVGLYLLRDTDLLVPMLAVAKTGGKGRAAGISCSRMSNGSASGAADGTRPM